MPDLEQTLRWLVAPATDKVPRLQAVGAATLRVLVGLLWLYNVSWKNAPDFGKDSDSGLYFFTSYAVEYPVFPPYSWLVEQAVLPFFTPFGWAVLVVETALAVLLLTGAWVRVAALIGLGQSLAIGLSVAYAPHEWPWSYWLMIGAHLLLLVSSAGRVLAVDAVRAGVSPARILGLTWGVIGVLVGLYSVVGSVDDPLASRGPGLSSSDLSISLGQYNLVGGAVLVVAGALLLVSARAGSALSALLAAGLTLLAALSLHAQLGFSDPLLGGNTTSAAVLFSLAVVAAAVASTRAAAPTPAVPAAADRR